MKGTDYLLICFALFGFLPLASFLYKKRRADRILNTGRTTNAVVFNVATNRKSNYEIVNYYFIAPDGKQYRGRLTTRPGVHKLNSELEVYYLPDNPAHNTVKGNWSSTGFLIFMIIIAIVVLYMAYKLYEMLNKKG